MSKSSSALRHHLLQLSEPVRECLAQTRYTPPAGANVSVKTMLQSLLPQNPSSPLNPSDASEEDLIRSELRDFSLCCAALVSSEGSPSDHLSWIPKTLSQTAASAIIGMSEAFSSSFDAGRSKIVIELGLDCGLIPDKSKLVVDLMPIVLPLLKDSIKESSIGTSEVNDEVSAASARVPVAYAIVAAYQLRWFVKQVEDPHLGKIVSLVMPCTLTALDHWSPEVKSQGMISIIHLAKNVRAAEIGCYEDVILDACCQNIASSDEIWHLVVEMSVLLGTRILRNNPRSPWFEKILNEMFSHLERQPRNKERCVAWLELVDPLFSCLGLVLLVHFRRIFPLFFQWMHVDDDEIIVLVLKRIHTVIRMTWISHTPYVERLVDKLAIIYKEAAVKKGREEIRTLILQILVLLQQCKGAQFESAWIKHRDDPNLTTLGPSFCGRNSSVVV